MCDSVLAEGVLGGREAIRARTIEKFTHFVQFVLGFEGQLSTSSVKEILLSLNHARPRRRLDSG